MIVWKHSCITYFAQSCGTFMDSRYLKAGTTKMASGKDSFFHRDDVDALLAITDADMFENNKYMESEIVTESWNRRL